MNVAGILATCFATLPAVIFLIRFAAISREGRARSLFAFTMGGLSIIPLIGLSVASGFFSESTAFFAAFAVSAYWTAFYEEIWKFFTMLIADERYIKSTADAIEYAIMTALGFAVAENAVYFYAAFKRGVDFWVLSGRTFVTMPVHMIATGTLGYFYGIGRFHKHLLPKGASTVGYVLKGIIAAVVIHGTFNLSVSSTIRLYMASDYEGALSSILPGIIILGYAGHRLYSAYFRMIHRTTFEHHVAIL